MDIRKGQQLFDQRRAAGLMAEAGLDVIIASRRQNVAYLSGHFSLLYWEYPEVAHCLEKEDDGCEAPYYFAAVPQDPGTLPFVVAHYSRAGIWKGDCWIADVRECCDKPGKAGAVDRLVEAIEERGLGGGTIGVEMNHVPAGVLRELEPRLPEATFADATPTIWKMRMVKTDRELARQRQAYWIAERIYAEVFRALRERPGITVGEIRGMQMALAAEAGCPPIQFGYVFPQDGKTRFAWQTGHPGERIEQGDVVLLDIGLIHEGYITDFGRNAVLGRASQGVKDAYEKTLELRRAVASCVKPGVRACDVHRVGASFREKLGWERPNSLGHGLGIECHEPPLLMADDETVLEEGMTVVIELVTGVDGVYFLLEDAGLVTSAGWESLSSLSPDLVELE